MVMNSVQWIAAIVIVLSAIKMLVLLIKPSAWMGMAKSVWAKPKTMKVVALILGAIVLYYLDAAGISIVTILAVTAFVALLLMVGLADEVPYFMKKYDDLAKSGGIWKKYWLYALIWVVLLLWGAKVLWM
jgi:hypothetical protein